MAEIIPHNRLTFSEAECEAVARTVRSGHWSQGPGVQALEAALARIGGVKHAVCVASGLSALRLSLGALGVRSSHSVLVPAYSCVALANAALAWGATPIPVEIEALSWNVGHESCREAIAAHHPRAVIAVNTFGVPVELDGIIASGVPVIEDCAHAFGIAVGGKDLGSRAQLAVLSFYATKLIGGGEGGAVLTNQKDIADYVRLARDYNDQPASPHRMNDKMNDLEAALVLAQLERLPDMISARQTIARRYLDMLSNSSHFDRLYRIPADTKERVWYRLVVEMLAASAATAVEGLQRFNIHAAIPVTDWRPAGSPQSPVTDRAYRRVVSLPLYPTLTSNEQDRVVKTFLKVCEDSARG